MAEWQDKNNEHGTVIMDIFPPYVFINTSFRFKEISDQLKREIL